MAEKVRCQLMVDLEHYQWLIEEMTGRRHKNLSQTINELLRNYKIMLRAVDRAREQEQKAIDDKKEIKAVADNYHEQLKKAVIIK